MNCHVIKHGSTYFKEKGVKCPECQSTMYIVHSVCVDDTGNGAYSFRCICQCEFYVQVNDTKIEP